MKNILTIVMLTITLAAFGQSKKNEIVFVYENVPTEVAFGLVHGKQTMRIIRKSNSFQQQTYEGNVNVSVWTVKNCKHTYSVFSVTNAGAGTPTLYTLIKHKN